MKFKILDVDHGFCALLVADNGNIMLFDCGHKTDPEFRPSTYLQQLRCSGIEYFFISNYDEDHISDLPEIRRLFTVQLLCRNKSITTAQLRELKRQSGPLSEAMKSFLEMNDRYVCPPTEPTPELPGVEYKLFHNDYGSDFEDTNNISLVTFLKCNDTRFVLPGDIETAGWEKLLEKEAFRALLRGVDYFVASHHGREDGYCADVFKYCSPKAVIFSDGPIRHATQEMANTYAKHATGISFNNESRKVLSTRKDGSLNWNHL